MDLIILKIQDDGARSMGYRVFRTTAFLLALLVSALLAISAAWCGLALPAQADQLIARHVAPVFPLKVSANGRYLVDQNEVPFLLVGDSPQALIGNLTMPQAELYMENRASYGFNAIWINLLCNSGTACQPDGETVDGLGPFDVPGDLSTPNKEYFDRAKAVIRLASKNDLVVLLNPIETIGWLDVLRGHGVNGAFAYGVFLGKTFAPFPNIVWLYGNDFQSWKSSLKDDGLLRAVAAGISSVDHVHISSVELNYPTSGSLDDPTWRPLIDIDAAYTYYPTYAQVLTEYNRPAPMPVFLVEANYEFERNAGTDGGAPANLRRQAYWTMLSGATGLLYGSAYTWQFPRGWETKLDSVGVRELQYMTHLFEGVAWEALVPDQYHKTVVAGYGSYSDRGSIASDTYAAAAGTQDGSLLMVYLPTPRPIVVDMRQLHGTMAAQWYDPTSGALHDSDTNLMVAGGHVTLTPPGKNASGDADWVLVISPAAKVRSAAN